MTQPDPKRAAARLLPAYGLIVGAVIGVVLGALDVVPVVWGLIVGAALGLVAGAAAVALATRR